MTDWVGLIKLVFFIVRHPIATYRFLSDVTAYININKFMGLEEIRDAEL